MYPAIEPYQQEQLPVSDLHSLYLEQLGNPDGLPVIFLHGGPGAGCSPSVRQLFDPVRYRIVLFDQRGCGLSTPHAELRENTTQDLIADIEKIRQHLGIESWVVAGGSWGTTLGLAYAQAYPERVLGMILRGVFLCRQQDLDWLYGFGTARMFPQEWAAFLAPLSKEERQYPIAAYHKILTDDSNPERQIEAASAWGTWEGTPATLLPNPDVVQTFSQGKIALSLARISTHYFVHHCFLRENQLLMDMPRIQHLPAKIVQGRYDMLCPVENAWALKQCWDKADLDIVPDAGHAASEPGIMKALVKASDELADGLI